MSRMAEDAYDYARLSDESDTRAHDATVQYVVERLAFLAAQQPELGRLAMRLRTLIEPPAYGSPTLHR